MTEQIPSTVFTGSQESELLAYEAKPHMDRALRLISQAKDIENYLKTNGITEMYNMGYDDVAELGIAAEAEFAAANAAMSLADAAYDGKIKQM